MKLLILSSLIDVILNYRKEITYIQTYEKTETYQYLHGKLSQVIRLVVCFTIRPQD